jgi:hypothetical protein
MKVIFKFYIQIWLEITICIWRFTDSRVSHPRKLQEIFGLLMLVTVAVLPVLLIASGIWTIYNVTT